MKRFICIVVSVVLVLTLFGCAQNSEPKGEKVTPLGTPIVYPTSKSELWYENIRRSFLKYSFSVVETEKSYFYCEEEGLYEYVKDTKEVKCILLDDVGSLRLYKGDLYIALHDQIKKMDLNTRILSDLWNKSLSDFTNNDTYFEIHAFDIYEGFLYIWDSGTSVFRVNLENNKAESFLIDTYRMVLQGDNCFNIDHAARTFSIFAMNCETKEVNLIRGDGEYSKNNENKTVLIDEIFKVDEDIFYAERATGKIYKLNVNGTDEIVATPEKNSDVYDFVDFIYTCQTSNLYYRVIDKDDYKLYIYNPNDEDSLIMSFEESPVIIAITDSLLVYEMGGKVNIKEL